MSDHRADTESAGGHRYKVRVYYEDTDAGGVVYHANYLRFAERARTETLRDLDVAHAEMTTRHGLMFMVRRMKLDYLAPARLDDQLLVLTRPLVLRAASVELRQSIFRCGGDSKDHGPRDVNARGGDMEPGDMKPGDPGGMEAGGTAGGGVNAGGAVRPLVTIDVLLACVRAADMRPGRVPERWRSALMSLS